MILDKNLCFVATEVFAFYLGGLNVAENIPHYKNDPVTNAATAPELKLFRPNINYPKAVLYILIHIAVAFFAALIWTLVSKKAIDSSLSDFLLKTLISFLLVNILTLRFTLIWFVRVYQRYAKSETRLRCCMTPSCSEYAILAFKKYGAIIGGIKTFRRLLRCHPPGGVDYP